MAGQQALNMAKLKDVLASMVSSYSDLTLLARGQVVDANEVAQAIAKADPDSAEMVALQALAKWNPVATQETAPAEVSVETTKE
jgi:predicted ABC-type ATPase